MGATWSLLLPLTLIPILFLLLLTFQLVYVLCYRHHFLRRCATATLNMERSIDPSGAATDPLSTPSPSKELVLYHLCWQNHSVALVPPPAPANESIAFPVSTASLAEGDATTVAMEQGKSEEARINCLARDEEASLPPPMEVESDEEEDERSTLFYTPPDTPTRGGEPTATSSERFCRKDAVAGAGVGVCLV